MKVFLMHRSQDLDLEAALPVNEEALAQDLELNTLLTAMSRGDEFLHEVSRRALLTGLIEPDAVRYRQGVLADCLHHPDVLRELYEIAVVAAEGQKRTFFGVIRDSPDAILSGSLRVLEVLLPLLVRLRKIADTSRDSFRSEGWLHFFDMLRQELSDGYIDEVSDHLRALNPRRGVVVNAELGQVTRPGRISGAPSPWLRLEGPPPGMGPFRLQLPDPTPR